MTRDEAKSLLCIYKPGLENDFPEVKDALRLLETDPELKTWFEREQNFDRQLRGAIETIQPPSDLKDRILSAARQQHEPLIPFEPEARKSNPVTPWWRQNVTYSVAACILLIAVLSILLYTAQPRTRALESGVMIAGLPVPEFVNQLGQTTRHHGNYDYINNDIRLIREYLISKKAPAPSNENDIPEDLQKLEGLGCMTFKYEDVDITMICFKGDKIYHLYVGNRSKLPCDAPTKPAIDRFENKSAATWVKGNLFYVLTAEGSLDEVNDWM